MLYLLFILGFCSFKFSGLLIYYDACSSSLFRLEYNKYVQAKSGRVRASRYYEGRLNFSKGITDYHRLLLDMFLANVGVSL